LRNRRDVYPPYPVEQRQALHPLDFRVVTHAIAKNSSRAKRHKIRVARADFLVSQLY
jgi:hypothetical protein